MDQNQNSNKPLLDNTLNQISTNEKNKFITKNKVSLFFVIIMNFNNLKKKRLFVIINSLSFLL